MALVHAQTSDKEMLHDCQFVDGQSCRKADLLGLCQVAVAVDDGLMTRWKRLLRWGSLVVAGLALLGLGVFFTSTGLDKADKWASVIGGFATLIGLGLSVYGVVLARRGPEDISAGQLEDISAGQSVTDSMVSGSVTQVRRVRGSVRLDSASLVPPVVGPPSSGGTSTYSSAPPAGGQSVTRSQVAGPTRQIDDVGGDVELDR